MTETVRERLSAAAAENDIERYQEIWGVLCSLNALSNPPPIAYNQTGWTPEEVEALVGQTAWQAFYGKRVVDDIDVVPRNLLMHIWIQIHKTSTVKALQQEASKELTEKITERVAKAARTRDGVPD